VSLRTKASKAMFGRLSGSHRGNEGISTRHTQDDTEISCETLHADNHWQLLWHPNPITLSVSVNSNKYQGDLTAKNL
jgi:hypothetical protein